MFIFLRSWIAPFLLIAAGCLLQWILPFRGGWTALVPSPIALAGAVVLMLTPGTHGILWAGLAGLCIDLAGTEAAGFSLAAFASIGLLWTWSRHVGIDSRSAIVRWGGCAVLSATLPVLAAMGQAGPQSVLNAAVQRQMVQDALTCWLLTSVLCELLRPLLGVRHRSQRSLAWTL